MKKRAKLLCLFLCGVMLLGLLAGCGSAPAGGTEDVPPSAGNAQGAAPGTPPAPDPEPTAPPATVLTAEKDAELRARLQTAIDGILNTPTEIVKSDTHIPGETYTGTAWYVSSSDGKRNNDGLSPETPWDLRRLVDEVNAFDFPDTHAVRPGDAVFFKRGDVFRMEPHTALMVRVGGVTFSAYGEGPKPVLTMSAENGAGAGKWSLEYSDDSGVKIWKFYRDLLDTAAVICNDGEVISTRVYEYFDASTGEYVSCTYDDWYCDADNCFRGVRNERGLLPLEEALTENHSIVSRPVRIGDFYGALGVGPLYFRCDEGDPGDLYDSIEFSEMCISGMIFLDTGDPITGSHDEVVFDLDDTAIDNISFQCDGIIFIKGIGLIHGTVVQNCEFAYCLGCAAFYEENELGCNVGIQGDEVYGFIQDTTIRNNYFHDGQSPAATYEWDQVIPDVRRGYYRCLNNVMVNTFSIRLDTSFPPLQEMDSLIVRGNQVWNTGSINNGKLAYAEGSLLLPHNRYGECIVEDNLFYTTAGGHPTNALFNIWYYSDEFEPWNNWKRPTIRRNTYVQYAGQDMAYFLAEGPTRWPIDDPATPERMRTYFGDEGSEYYVIPTS